MTGSPLQKTLFEPPNGPVGDPWPSVLFVNHTGVLGGAELFLIDVVRHCKGHCAVLLLSDGPLRKRLGDAGIQVAVLPAGNLLALSRHTTLRAALTAVGDLIRLVFSLRKIERPFDIVYANSQKAFTVAALTKVLTRKPLIWMLHDILDTGGFGRLGLRLQVALANRFADSVIVYSEARRIGYIRSGGKADLTGFACPGIDPAPFDAITAQETLHLREDLAINDRVVIGCFSRLAPWKGQRLLIDCMPALPENVHLLLVGAPLFGEDEYEASLKRRVSELGIGHRISFGGFCANVPLYMKACDLIVHTSTAPEPFGRVVLEGMLAKRPVVAADCAGPAEMIDHNKTGFLYRMGDQKELEKVLLELIRYPSIPASVVEPAYLRATSHFSVAGMVRQQEDHILNVKRRFLSDHTTHRSGKTTEEKIVV